MIDFAITAPVALYGFLCFPDTPETTKAFYLSKEERELAVRRMPKRRETKLSWDIFRRVLGRWYVAPWPRGNGADVKGKAFLDVYGAVGDYGGGGKF